MSILAQMARAERIRAKALKETSAKLRRTDIDQALMLISLALAAERTADLMEAEVRAEFAKEIADGAV